MTRRLASICGGLAVLTGAVAGEDVPYSRDGADTCLGCHDDPQTLALFAGPHAVPTDPRGPFGQGQLQCEACHGPGGNHAARVRRGEERPPVVRFGSGGLTEVSVQNAMCTGCHAPDLGFGWHGGPHDLSDVACADCHTSHGGVDPVLETATQPEICANCHRRERNETLKAFAHPVDDGAMACTGCHSPHGETTEGQLVQRTINDTCYACHAEKRGPYLWEHQPATEDCTLCHSPHGSNQPAMLARRAPLLCQGCHAEAGHPSIVHDADGVAAAIPSQYLLGNSCLNCHTQVHGSNHPSGSRLMR
ncbi:MAG TPA: DmsE family decaheme c-type cytochrome [Woeseiaceae bacterium]